MDGRGRYQTRENRDIEDGILTEMVTMQSPTKLKDVLLLHSQLLRQQNEALHDRRHRCDGILDRDALPLTHDVDLGR